MWSITIENNKKGDIFRAEKWIKKNVIQHLVSLGRSSSPLHIFAWQYLHTILCKITPNLSDCEDFVQPSLGHHSHSLKSLGSDWALAQL